ncbi:MAG TPA: hypothetical protein VM307_02200 [Egibacteraceae bacterium]|nr:hypothetical protein [Egibacteraceae bacterium]
MRRERIRKTPRRRPRPDAPAQAAQAVSTRRTPAASTRRADKVLARIDAVLGVS